MLSAFIARLQAPRQRIAPEHPSAPVLPLITTRGASNVVAYFTLRSPLEHQFATDRVNSSLIGDYITSPARAFKTA